MKRYKSKLVMDIIEDKEGAFVRYSDALESMHAAVKFAVKHADDIEAGVDDFDELMPVLDLVRAGSAAH